MVTKRKHTLLLLLTLSAFLIGGKLFAASAPSGGTKLVMVGTKKVDKGWGDDFASVLEEAWSYLIHGHGRRKSVPVYKSVPVDFGLGNDDGSGDSQIIIGDPPSDGGSDGNPTKILPPDDGGGSDDGTGDLPPDDSYDDGDPLIGNDPPSPGTAPAPEPATLAALLAGIAGSCLVRRKRKRT